MAENLADKIARLQAILDAGATSGTFEGQSVTFDLANVRRQLRQAQAELAATEETDDPRPVASRIVF